MNRTVYINGQYLDEEQACVSVFDRGFLFADAVYEVCAVINGQLLQFEGHIARLERSCHELQLRLPVTAEKIREIHQQLIKKNQLLEGGIYLQLTRGRDKDRNFAFPPPEVNPTLVLFTQSKNLLDDPVAQVGIKILSVPDLRWKRRDIKTVQLLSATLAKQYALNHGADDALFVQDGYVTEGSSNNAFIVTTDNTIVTRPLSHDLLHGITRHAVLELIAQTPSLKLQERLFTLDEVKAAREAFITSALTFVHPVISIDGQTVGSGQPGPVTTRLQKLYLEMALKEVQTNEVLAKQTKNDM